MTPLYLTIIIISFSILIFQKVYNLTNKNQDIKETFINPGALAKALKGIVQFVQNVPEILEALVEAVISFFMNFIDLFMAFFSVFEWVINIPKWAVNLFLFLIALITDLLIIVLTFFNPVVLLKTVVKLILAIIKIILSFIFDTIVHLIRIGVGYFVGGFKNGLWGIPHGPEQHVNHRFNDSNIPIDDDDLGYGDHHHKDHNRKGFLYKPMRCYKEMGANSFINIVATIICPPLGVFMAFGLSGWFKLLVCCLLTLFYYFPGLLYALLITTHLGIGDDLEFADCKGTTGGYIVKGCEHRKSEEHCNNAYLPHKTYQNGDKIRACKWIKDDNSKNKGKCRNYLFDGGAGGNMVTRDNAYDHLMSDVNSKKTNLREAEKDKNYGKYYNYTEDHRGEDYLKIKY